ncbi:MAG: hypothetical protein ACOC5T_08940 [Elusimicrobiota bacterium]
MKKIKILNQYDYDFRSWIRNNYSSNEFGFRGYYVHKDMGRVDVMLTQLSNDEYVLMLDITSNGKEYHRNIELDGRCTYRFAGLQAKKFLEDLNKKLNEEKKNGAVK